MTARSQPVTVQGIPDAIGLTAGNDYTCALRLNRTVWCWGSNTHATLGNAQYSDGMVPQYRTAPEEIGAGSQRISDAVSVHAGITDACLIRATGAVVCWGYNGWNTSYGLLGSVFSGDKPLVAVPTLTDTGSVSVGNAWRCATQTRKVWCWGSNVLGTIGDGTIGTYRKTPTEVIDLPPVTSIATGFGHACAITIEDSVKCWGKNRHYALARPLTFDGSPSPIDMDLTVHVAPEVDGIIDTSGPFSQIQATKDLQCGRRGPLGGLFGILRPVLFSPVGCGTWVRAGSTVFGPDADGLDGEWQRATRSWTPVDQAESGSGTADDPWEITTSVRGGDELQVTQVDSYVDGSDFTETWVSIENVAGHAHDVTTYLGGDCMIGSPDSLVSRGLGMRTKLLGSPLEYGWQTRDDRLTSASGCASSPYNGNFVTIDPVEDSSRPTDTQSFTTNAPSVVAGQIGARELDGSVLTGALIDGAALVAQKLVIGAGEKLRLKYRIRYGRTDLSEVVPTPIGPDPDGPGGESTPPTAAVPWNMQAVGLPKVLQKTKLTGKGWSVAVVDTGVDNQHPWLGAPVAEACWSTEMLRRIPLVAGFKLISESGFITGTCLQPDFQFNTDLLASKIETPSGGPVPEYVLDAARAAIRGDDAMRGLLLDSMVLHDLTRGKPRTGPGTARPKLDPCQDAGVGQLLTCTANVVDFGVGETFFQGTFVAGIAAGKNPGSIGGVAPGSSVVAANVSSWREDSTRQTLNGPVIHGGTVVANPNDQARALNWIARMAGYRKIAAVNLMLPGRLYKTDRTGYSTGTCTGSSPALENAIKRVIANRIPVVVAAGDNSDKKRLPWPACLPEVISVGATNEADQVIKQSNSSRQLTLLAPGQNIRSATTGDRRDRNPADYTIRTGTYAAAAHVTGAIALLRQKYPNATPTAIKTLLRTTGIPTRDPANGRTTPRLRLDRLLINTPNTGSG